MLVNESRKMCEQGTVRYFTEYNKIDNVAILLHAFFILATCIFRIIDYISASAIDSIIQKWFQCRCCISGWMIFLYRLRAFEYMEFDRDHERIFQKDVVKVMCIYLCIWAGLCRFTSITRRRSSIGLLFSTPDLVVPPDKSGV